MNLLIITNNNSLILYGKNMILYVKALLITFP